MNTHPEQPSPNGTVQAPPILSGASGAATNGNRRTIFPQDVPLSTPSALAYASRRFLLGGAPASRYVSVLLVVLAGIWATGLLPGRWIGMSVFLGLLAVHLFFGRSLQRRDYVRFESVTMPELGEDLLDPSESLPVYVTGALAVEGNEQRFTFLPGFYKSFATREHALLCLVRTRRILGVLHWPEFDHGMWYAFFQPSDVRRIEWGKIDFLRAPTPCIAVHYEDCRPVTGRFRKTKGEQCTEDVLYISSQDEGVLHKVLADLLADESVRDAVPEIA